MKLTGKRAMSIVINREPLSTRRALCLVYVILAVALALSLPGMCKQASAACGDAGQACCPRYRSSVGFIGPEHCNAGLGCNVATKKCVSPCGGNGQVCCDGPDTNANQSRWFNTGQGLIPTKPMCATGSCDSVTRRCTTCGGAEGDQCCSPDINHAVFHCVDDNLTCRGGLVSGAA